VTGGVGADYLEHAGRHALTAPLLGLAILLQHELGHIRRADAKDCAHSVGLVSELHVAARQSPLGAGQERLLALTVKQQSPVHDELDQSGGATQLLVLLPPHELVFCTIAGVVVESESPVRLARRRPRIPKVKRQCGEVCGVSDSRSGDELRLRRQNNGTA
jgi:hypothetical protein